MDRRQYLRALGVGGAASLAGCGGDAPGRTPGSGGALATDGPGRSEHLTVGTATTAADSGLLDALVPPFQASFGVEVRVLVRGTGAAIRTARDGDCDLVVAHAREAEDAFLRSGGGLNRRALMRNDYLVVGPSADPADAAGMDPLAALRAIADAGARFLSRGDGSGTHRRERTLWEHAGVDPRGRWYRETGQGMGDTLVAADRQGAYTLTDRGTFATIADRTGLVAHVDRGIADPPPLLRNEYGVLVTNPALHDVAYPLALALVGFLTGPGQGLIDAFRTGGEQVFLPSANTVAPNFEQYVPLDWDG